jgi:tetratricopeptide (TPR) repeat protein
VKLHEAVIPQLARTVGAQNITTLDAKYQLAKCYPKMDQAARAAPLMREYADGQSRVMGERSPQTLQLLNRLAIALLDAKQFETAEEFAGKVLSSGGGAGSSPAITDARSLLGQIVAARGRYAEAEPMLVESITAYDQQASGGSTKSRKQRAVDALSDLYEQTGRHAEATALRSGQPRATTLSAP